MQKSKQSMCCEGRPTKLLYYLFSVIFLHFILIFNTVKTRNEDHLWDQKCTKYVQSSLTGGLHFKVTQHENEGIVLAKCLCDLSIHAGYCYYSLKSRTGIQCLGFYVIYNIFVCEFILKSPPDIVQTILCKRICVVLYLFVHHSFF